MCCYSTQLRSCHGCCALAELLYGGNGTGVFQFNNVLNLSSKTADGVVGFEACQHVRRNAIVVIHPLLVLLQEFTATSTQKGESLETVVKAVYGTKNYKLSTSLLPDGKVSEWL